ncbi:WD40 repeat domain-containing protein [Legionella lytica]|uniref:WD40 repeat domain-containing protein n=1 Tax=Legionella lytica TaxID=96232 RepID=A0ABW8DAL0_9GAMM
MKYLTPKFFEPIQSNLGPVLKFCDKRELSYLGLSCRFFNQYLNYDYPHIKQNAPYPFRNYNKPSKTTSKFEIDNVDNILILPDNRLALSAKRNLIILDIESNQYITSKWQPYRVSSLAKISANTIISQSYGGYIDVWDISEFRHIKSLTNEPNKFISGITVLSQELVALLRDQKIEIWNLETGKCVKEFDGWGWYAPTGLEKLPDGRLIAGSFHGDIGIWDIEKGECVEKLSGHKGAINCLKVLPNGDLISGADDNTIRIWDVKKSKTIRELKGHTGPITSVEELPNRCLISSAYDGTIKIWNTDDGSFFDLVKTKKPYIGQIKVLPQGNIIVAFENTLEIYHFPFLEMKSSSVLEPNVKSICNMM